MANAVKILKDVSSSNFGGISSAVKEFLQPVFNEKLVSGCQEAKCYSNFVMKFLHTLTGKVKSLKKDEDITEVLEAAALCCRAYNLLQQGLDPDKAYTVPKIVYHIINHFKNQHSHVEQLVCVSELVYQMLCAHSLTEDGHVLVNGLYACLWNTCCKLAATLDKGSSEALDVRLKLRKCSLLFLAFLPDKDLLLEKLRCVVSHFLQVTSNLTPSSFITSCCEITCEIFEGIIESKQKNACTLEHHHLILTLKGMFVEHLVKSSRLSQALTVAKSIQQTGHEETSKICEAISVIYSFHCQSLLDKNDDRKSSEVDFQLVSRGCRLAQEILQLGTSCDTLSLLYEPFYLLTQSVGKKSLSAAGLSWKEAGTLVEACDVFLDIAVRLVADGGVQGGADVRRREESGRVYLSMLVIHYRQLHFLLQLIQAGSCEIGSRSLLEMCVERASQLQQRLEESCPHLASSAEYTHRYNCGYVCSSLGKVSVQEKQYEWATIFYKVAVQQLHLCKHSNLPRLYEMLIECYIKQEKWVEGTQVVIESLTRVQEGLTFSTTLWTRLKMAALAKDQQIFQDLSLCSAVKSSGTPLPGVTDRQILYAEYLAWKKQARKDYDVKHNLLCELYTVPQSPVELGQVMIDLAVSMCITGYTHQDRSAGEMLSKAILQLDKESGPTVEALLALAHYTKYVVCHEETIEKMQDASSFNSQTEGDIEKNQPIGGSSTAFTFQSERPYLPFLERALQLWESSLGASKDQGQTVRSDKDGALVDLEQHVDALILCGSRLLAMRQTKMAWRALSVAQAQLDRITEPKQVAEVLSHLSQVLLVQGRYEEAEKIISLIISKDPSDRNCLLYAELCLLMGKKEEGMATLHTVIERQELCRRTQNVFLIDGTAKRLMSMFLCFPEGHVILPTNEYLLSLAFEAVRCHISVLNFMTNKKVLENNTDKWQLVHEILQSLLHLCQLYRFIGLPRDALCYLKEGLRITQAMGLPRWSCEFLFEILHIRSLTAECDQGVEIVESINTILASSDTMVSDTIHMDENPRKTAKGRKKSVKALDSEESSSKTPVEHTDREELTRCFGFDELSSKVTPKAVNVTPEKDCVREELDSAKKHKMTKISVPKCSCMLEKKRGGVCDDDVRHRLCLKAGLVLAEFLTQSDMRDTAGKLLADVSIHLKGTSKDSNSCDLDMFLKNGQTDKVCNIDPQMVYISLEASCLQAENYLHQKEFQKIRHVWEKLSKLEQTGCLKNVLHSNILLSRLALCSATSYMFSNHLASAADKSDKMTGSRCVMTGNGTGQLSNDIEPLSVRHKKVSFGDNEPALMVEGTALKGARRKLMKDSNGSVELDSESFATPKGKTFSAAFSSSKKQTMSRLLKTPLSSRQAALDFLMESDNDEDDDNDVVFPTLKPVTPKVVKSDKRSVKSKTEPRKSRNTKGSKLVSQSVEGLSDDPVCKFTDLVVNKGTNSNIEVPAVETPVHKEDTSANEFNEEIENLEACVESLSLESAPKTKSKIPLAVKRSDKEEVADVQGTIKSKTRKTVSKKTRNANKENKAVPNDSKQHLGEDVPVITENIVHAESAAKMAVLTEKSSNVKAEKPLKNHLNVDVFDFDLEASPAVNNKTVKKGKGKATKATNKTNVSRTSAAIKGTKSKLIKGGVAEGAENNSSPPEKLETKPKVTRARRGKKLDALETVRNTSTTDSEIELNISYQEIEQDNEPGAEIDKMNVSIADAFCVPEPCNELYADEDCDMVDALVDFPVDSPVAPPVTPALSETLSNSYAELEAHARFSFGGESNELEPIEIMRGDTKKKGRTRATRQKKTVDGESSKKEGQEEEVCAETSGAGVEKMRSGKLASLKGLTDMLSCGPDVCEPGQEQQPGESSPLESSMVQCLEALYSQTRHVAPYPQHPDLCHMLALHYLDMNPHRAAFLFTDSIAVTFRHQAMLNVGKKVRKHCETSNMATNMSCEQLTCVRDEFLFDKDEQHLEKMINVIPREWNVIQLSVVNAGLPCRQFILTRFVRDQPPVVVRLPAFNTPQGRDLLKDFSNLLETNRSTAKIDSKEEWWSLRDKLDKDLQTITEHMESFWLGPWKSIFLPGEYSGEIIQTVQREVWRSARLEINMAQTEILLQLAREVNDTQLLTCASELLRSVASQSQLRSVISVVKKHGEPDLSKSDTHHVVLILDKTVQHLPWESMPCLLPQSVTRMPCLAHLYTQLTYLHSQESSVFTRGVNPSNTYYIVNPDSNLQHTDDRFRDWFLGEKSWTGVIGSRPTKEQFTEALTNSDLLIYCGHGSGGRFFNSDEIEKLQGQAATILMGCSSGKLFAKGQLEPSGMMISYFLAGCPCMVANLWDVTDKDIDKFTAELLQTWIAEDGASLPRYVQKSRQACKMKYLNGSAPVVYGLPVFINKKGHS